MFHLFMYNICIIVNVKSMGTKHQNLWFNYDYIIINQYEILELGRNLCHLGEGSVFKKIFKDLLSNKKCMITSSKYINTVSNKKTERYYKKLEQTLCRLGEGSVFKLLMQNYTSKIDSMNINNTKIKLYTGSSCRADRADGHLTLPIKYLHNTFSYGKITK